MQRILIPLLAALIVLGGVFFLLSSRNKTSSPSLPTQTRETPSPQPSAAASPSGAMKEGAVKEFTVTGRNFSFNPSTLSINKGDKVRVTFKSEGGFHDFVIDEFSVRSKTVGTGLSDMLEFTADKTGTFKYYCSIGNHRAMGMEGTLTVQ